MPPRPVKQWEYEIRPHGRLRETMHFSGTELVNFCIALEHELAPGDWREVARIDAAGGTVHRDRLRPDGSVWRHRERVSVQDFDLAILWARREFGVRYDRYIQDWRRWL